MSYLMMWIVTLNRLKHQEWLMMNFLPEPQQWMAVLSELPAYYEDDGVCISSFHLNRTKMNLGRRWGIPNDIDMIPIRFGTCDAKPVGNL